MDRVTPVAPRWSRWSRPINMREWTRAVQKTTRLLAHHRLDIIDFTHNI
jgi:hypothetical protein